MPHGTSDLVRDVHRIQEEDVLEITDLSLGSVIEVETEHHTYTLELLAEDTEGPEWNREVRVISNHPKYEGPFKATLTGSTSGGSSLICGRIVIGLLLELWPEEWSNKRLKTSEIISWRVVTEVN